MYAHLLTEAPDAAARSLAAFMHGAIYQNWEGFVVAYISSTPGHDAGQSGLPANDRETGAGGVREPAQLEAAPGETRRQGEKARPRGLRQLRARWQCNFCSYVPFLVSVPWS